MISAIPDVLRRLRKAVVTVLARLGVSGATRLDDRVAKTVAARLIRRGWRAYAIPMSGYGDPTAVRVIVRVVLRPTAEVAGGRRRRRRIPAGLQPFLTAEVPHARVQVRLAGTEVTAVCDREGYVDTVVRLDEALEPGWHDVSYQVVGGVEVTTGRVPVVDPHAPLAVVSDIDDTALVTGLTQRLKALRNTFFTHGDKRLAVPGAAALLRGLTGTRVDDTLGTAQETPGAAPVWYISTGAWNLHPMLVAFLRRTGFPLGPLLLTDWGPTGERIFRSGQAHKRESLTDLLHRFGRTRFVLLGDSGQHDAGIYAEIARKHPDRIAAIYVHDVGLHARAKAEAVRTVAAEVTTLGVPMLLVADWYAAALDAVERGLVDAAAVAAVRRDVEAAP